MRGQSQPQLYRVRIQWVIKFEAEDCAKGDSIQRVWCDNLENDAACHRYAIAARMSYSPVGAVTNVLKTERAKGLNK